MKKFYLFTKTLLVATVLLLVGASNAWADVTPYSENYEGDGASCDWTTNDDTRYTTSLAETSGNHYVQVSYAGTNGGNGTLTKSNSTNGKAASGDNYTLIFDLKITGGSNQESWFQVNDANNKDASVGTSEAPANCMLLFKLTTAGGSTWKINNNSEQTVTLNKSNWNRVKLVVYGGETYLTVTDLSTSTDVFAFAKITTNSTKGGLGGIQFATKRYYSSMAIDNVTVRAVTAADLVVATPTFIIGSYNYEQGGYAVTPSCDTEGATLTYKIGSGAATACTSGVPFYAKNGAVQITATKTGWTTSTTPEKERWTLNVAPSSSSPETLIPFQKSSDNGDKNIEHVYKSVTIAGGGSGALAGIVSGNANALKLRTNQSSNTVTLNVNSGYIITRVSIEAKSNNTGATIGLTSTTVDGGSNIMSSTTTFPASGSSAVTYDTNGTAINAKNNIVFTFDNSAIDGSEGKKSFQIQATIKVWYKTPVEIAIEDCKTYETSDAFATAIDAESFASVAEVYAFHSAWQIAKANNSGSTDYSKAILNRTFELHNTNGWTIYGDPATGGSDSDNNGIVEYGDGWSQYYTGWNGRNVSQNIATLPAGTYRLTAKVYSGSGGAPVRLFANGQLSDAENGEDHDPVLIFTVAGTEPSIKIGIGGTGHEDDTDNTWGNWWYRVKNFTLTRTAVSAKITDAGWTTFASPYALDLSSMTASTGDVAAYYASAAEGSEVTLTPTSAKIEAGEGIMIKGTAGATVSIPVTSDAATFVETNLLVGQTTTSTVYASNKDDNGKYHYVFGYSKDDASEYGFYNLALDTEVPAGKAYLEIEDALSLARALSIVFADEILTGIKKVENGEVESSLPVKRIVNGKLVIEKKGMMFNANGQIVK